MQKKELLKKAWINLQGRLADIRVAGEIAIDRLDGLDAMRRLGGHVVEGSIAEYCRCGKKECPDIGKAGHTIRYHLQTSAGAVNIPKRQIEAYRQALDANKEYRRALGAIRQYEQVCEKCYRAMGYISRDRDFESYLYSFSGGIPKF